MSDVLKRVVVQLVIVAKWIALACSTSHLEVLNFRWGKQLGGTVELRQNILRDTQGSIKQFLGSRERYNAKIMTRKRTI